MSPADKRRAREVDVRRRGIDPDESRRKATLDRLHGEGTYDRIVKLREEQNNLCGVCGRPEEDHYQGMIKHLKVDHCHDSGKVRGLICGRCNQALGHFQDDPALLLSAVDYLRKHSS